MIKFCNHCGMQHDCVASTDFNDYDISHMKANKEITKLRNEITRLRAEKERLRVVFARYNRSEGCGCCKDKREHDTAENELAEILGCPRYSDNSGWDWGAFLRADAALAAGGE